MRLSFEKISQKKPDIKVPPLFHTGPIVGRKGFKGIMGRIKAAPAAPTSGTEEGGQEGGGDGGEGGTTSGKEGPGRKSTLFDVALAAKADSEGENVKLRIFHGQFSFHSYDEKLEDFLDSLGMPGTEFGPLFRRSKVRISIIPPAKKKDTRWTMTHYDKGARFI